MPGSRRLLRANRLRPTPVVPYAPIAFPAMHAELNAAVFSRIGGVANGTPPDAFGA